MKAEVEYTKKTKNCTLCGFVFVSNSYLRKGTSNLVWYSRCNPCRNKLNLKRLHLKMPEKKVRKVGEYFLKQSLSWSQRNREKINALNKKWRLNNKEKWDTLNRINQQNRRALGSINSSEWIAKVMMLGNKCQSCFKTEPEIKITIDHVQPVSKGGTNHIDNLQPLCMNCNQKKHAKYSPVAASILINT